MKRKIIYTLVFLCCMSLLASAKQICTECPSKKCCTNKAAVKKQQAPVKKKTTASSIRPLNFYLFNI